MIDAYEVTRQFERALCEYTGAKYAVAVNSCTAAIELACHGFQSQIITLPSRTYCSVPMAVKRAGHTVQFIDYGWRGWYRLTPLPVYDCARRFTSGMYRPGDIQCVSFSSSKILGIEQGGCILHDNEDDDVWYREMRFDGRTEGVAAVDDQFVNLGLHCIMLPSIAAQLLLKLSFLPKHNEDLPEIPYPDLSKFEVFK